VLDNANLRVAREQAMLRLAASEERFRVSFDNAPNGIAVVSVEPSDFGRILETNDAFAHLVGYPLEQAGRLSFHAFVHPDDVGAGPRPEILDGTLTRWAEDLRFIRRSGEIIWVRTNASLLPDPFDGRRAAIIQVEDITARKGAEVQLAHRAMHDSLTDLPNRHLLMDRLNVALESAQRSSKTVALLYIDLDRFKDINDSLGHEAGDLLLKEVSRRLADAVRSPDTAARLAGDEFVVVCPEIVDQAHAEGIAGRLLEALDRPVTIGCHQVSPVASIGIALTQGDRTSPDEMLRWADQALYRAKATGRHRFTTYSPDDSTSLVHLSPG
jgi:diguanylate cyclase (GGDEF)-like protein/PAS domain S-box-containing protein